VHTLADFCAVIVLFRIVKRRFCCPDIFARILPKLRRCLIDLSLRIIGGTLVGGRLDRLPPRRRIQKLFVCYRQFIACKFGISPWSSVGFVATSSPQLDRHSWHWLRMQPLVSKPIVFQNKPLLRLGPISEGYGPALPFRPFGVRVRHPGRGCAAHVGPLETQLPHFSALLPTDRIKVRANRQTQRGGGGAGVLGDPKLPAAIGLIFPQKNGQG
jgi:hypothetical protein